MNGIRGQNVSATSQKVTYESYLLSYRFLIQLNHLVAYGKSQPSSLYLSLQQPIATYSSQAALLHIYSVEKGKHFYGLQPTIIV